LTSTALGADSPQVNRAEGAFDVSRIRSNFPILRQDVNGKPLVYLDNAASSQKPMAVINAISSYYEHTHANIHRGVHHLSQQATNAYEHAREVVARFINAPDPREVIFVRGTTEGINLVAGTYGRANVGPGDEVLITHLEHHSNIVPWQLLCEEKGAALKVIPMTESGDLRMDEYERLLTDRTKLVAVGHVSNALGTLNPLVEIVRSAHARGIPVVVDGAQAAPHLFIDVRALGCDFYAFSSHKMFGPTGIGALYGRAELLEAMPPYQGGGDMIATVSFEGSTYAAIPSKFEAGTPNIAGAVGFAAAVQYLDGLGRSSIQQYEDELVDYAVRSLRQIDGLRLIGEPCKRVGVVSFVLDDIHAHDLGTVLDQEGVAVRTGHHCAQPVMDFYHVPATVRASFAFYNTGAEVDALVAGLYRAKEVFAGG
jgi:cysteine desulfurase/selenocysteine lyase